HYVQYIALYGIVWCFCFFFQAEDGIRDWSVTGVQTCALPICHDHRPSHRVRSLSAAPGARGAAGPGLPSRLDLDRAPSSVVGDRSEERRVGEEGRSRWAPHT